MNRPPFAYVSDVIEVSERRLNRARLDSYSDSKYVEQYGF